ncbi:MAG: GntP family permease [Bacteroidales bacterium]|nr:GntP family permease [Bacteroidales bacterium]
MSVLMLSIVVFLSIVLIILLTSVAKLNAFISLFVVSLLLAIVAVPDHDVITILKEGFGNTMGSIGLLIIFGAIIAAVLDESGGAASIANYILSKTGKERAPAALGITGFIAGLPIFCDSGFIILSGLAKSFSSKTKTAMPFIAVVLATSLYSVHNIIPTHPGSLAASGMLNVNVGYLIVLGIIFAIPGALAAYFWVRWKTRKSVFGDESEESFTEDSAEKELPGVFKSLLPVAAPIVLIAINSLLSVFGLTDEFFLIPILLFLGQPIIALFVGVLLSLLLLKRVNIESINTLLERAIRKAGPILVVTAAGGMFGLVIKDTGIGTYAGEFLVQTGMGIAVPFLISAVLKTAQGSSTVAIITAAAFVTPILPVLGLDSETGKLLTMLAMSAGSMMISHANDSYFWVVTRFSGITPDTTLKLFSTATVIMGVTVFGCVLITSWFIL